MTLQSYRYTFVSRAEHKRATRGTRMCCTRNTDVLRHLFAGIKINMNRNTDVLRHLFAGIKINMN